MVSLNLYRISDKRGIILIIIGSALK